MRIKLKNYKIFFIFILSYFILILTCEFPNVPENSPPNAVIEILMKKERYFPGDSIRVSGTKSIDPEQNAPNKGLKFYWQEIINGHFENEKASETNFVPDSSGTFLISLVVEDEKKLTSKPAVVKVIVSDMTPIAKIEIEPCPVTKIGIQVMLFATNSIIPPGSKKVESIWKSLNGGELTKTIGDTTYFKSDSTGKYIIQLTVKNEFATSNAVLQTIIVGKYKIPTIKIDGELEVELGDKIRLNANSSEVDGTTEKKFYWRYEQSNKIYECRTGELEFIPDTPGGMGIYLKVTDGNNISSDTTIVINVRGDAINYPTPECYAGEDVTYILGDTVKLYGQGFENGGPPLRFYWQQAESNPDSVNIENIANPKLFLPLPGKYIFILYVDNGYKLSCPDQVKITIEKPDLYVTEYPDSSNQFRTITEALVHAKSGDLIFVRPGEYHESVKNFISNITLLSTNIKVTKVRGTDLGPCFFLQGVQNVTIKGFSLIEGGVDDPPYAKNSSCITCAEGSKDIVIENNHIYDGRHDGIRLFNASKILINNTVIEKNAVNGIRSTSSSFTVSNCQIKKNNPKEESNFTAGISIESQGEDVSGLNIQIKDRTLLEDNRYDQIKIECNSEVTIDDCIIKCNPNISNYEFDNFFGSGIFTKKIKITPTGNLTVKKTIFSDLPGAAIFCEDNATVYIEQNHFSWTKKRGNEKADSTCISLINCSGEIIENIIEKFYYGIILYYSPIKIVSNTFRDNEYGIRYGGDRAKYPKDLIDSYLLENIFEEIDDAKKVSYSGP